MRAIVYIRLKTEVLDPQGQAIESAGVTAPRINRAIPVKFSVNTGFLL